MRRAALALLALASCGPLVDTTGPSAANRAPVIRGVAVDPAVLTIGGSAVIVVDAVDPDGERVFYRFAAHAGVVTVPDPGQPGRALYLHGGGSTPSDRVQVTVVDTRNAAAIAHADIRLRVNSPPVVLVRSSGPCHPRCTASFTAEVTDADGDEVTYLWRGCASGTRPSATCTITAPVKMTAMVTVDDGHGGATTAVADAVGENQPPIVSGGGELRGVPATLTVTRTDPDGDETACGWSGDCQCTGRPLDFNLTCDIPPPLGFCRMFFRCTDPFGATAETSFLVNRS